MSRILASVAAGLLSLGIFSVAAEAKTTYERAVAGEGVKVAIYNQTPWGVRDESGKYRGYSVEVIREAFSRMGIKNYDLLATEFAALVPSLQAGRVDAITAGLFVNKDRCRLIAFGEPDIRIGDAALVKAGNPKNIHSYEDVAKNGELKIGTARGNATAADAITAGVPSDRQTLFQDTQAAVTALIAGRVDAVSATSGTIAALSTELKGRGLERALPFVGLKNADGLPKMNLAAVAFRKTDDDFRLAYNKALDSMKADGFLQKLLLEYGFGQVEFPKESTASVCE